MHTQKIPEGQYTNLLFQSKKPVLTENWLEVKRKYIKANIVLGYIPKVASYSKVMGDWTHL